MKKLVSVWVLMLVCTSVWAMPERPSAKTRGDYSQLRVFGAELVEAWSGKEDIEGISVVVVDDQQIVWSGGFGFADVERSVPATTQTVYGAGSVSTLFTAVAIMQLVEEGKVELDAPLTRYLPEFKIRSVYPATANLTIRQLLTHHAGLPSNLFNGMWSKKPDSLDTLMQKLADETAAYAPDYVMSMSYVGYSMLGKVIEKVTGTPFNKYMDERVLGPLGMKQSSFTPEKLPMAKAYKKGKAKETLWARDVPALGLNTNVSDLSRFLQAVFKNGNFGGKAVWSETSARELLREQNSHIALDMDRSVAFGWQLDSGDLVGAGVVASRAGGTVTHRSRVMVLPQHKLGIVILSNESNSFRAEESIAHELLALALEIKTGIAQPLSAEKRRPPLPAQTASFVSEYATNMGLISVRADGKNYRTNVMGWELKLTPRADDPWYRVEYSFLGLIPFKLDWVTDVGVAPIQINGRPAVTVLYKNHRYLLGVEYAVREPEKAWLARLGRYEPLARDELTDQMEITTGELKLENGRLVFAYRVPWRLPLTLNVPIQPIDADLALIPGLGAGLNEVVRVVRVGGQERLRYSGYELVRIKEEESGGFFD